MSLGGLRRNPVRGLVYQQIKFLEEEKYHGIQERTEIRDQIRSTDSRGQLERESSQTEERRSQRAESQKDQGVRIQIGKLQEVVSV